MNFRTSSSDKESDSSDLLSGNGRTRKTMTDNFDHPRWNVMTRPAIVCAMMLSYLLLGTETLFGFQLQFQPLFPNSRTAQNEENSVG